MNCTCHNQPMYKNGHRTNGSQKWYCKIKNRENYRTWLTSHPRVKKDRMKPEGTFNVNDDFWDKVNGEFASRMMEIRSRYV